MLCFRKFLVAKKFMDKREGEISRFPSKILCLTVPKNFVGEPFSVSLISGTEKVWMRGWGEYQDFLSKIFCLTVPKNFVGEPFSVSLILGTGKVWIREGGGVSRLLSHSAENFRRGILYCCNNFGYRKSLDKGGGRVSQFSVEVFVSLYRNISLENTLVFSEKFFYRKFSCIGGGGITVLSELFVSQYRNEKLCKGTLLFSGNFLVSKKIYG